MCRSFVWILSRVCTWPRENTVLVFFFLPLPLSVSSQRDDVMSPPGDVTPLLSDAASSPSSSSAADDDSRDRQWRLSDVTVTSLFSPATHSFNKILRPHYLEIKKLNAENGYFVLNTFQLVWSVAVIMCNFSFLYSLLFLLSLFMLYMLPFLANKDKYSTHTLTSFQSLIESHAHNWKPHYIWNCAHVNRCYMVDLNCKSWGFACHLWPTK